MLSVSWATIFLEKNMATYHDIVNAVREMMGRNLDVYEIASRLKIDVFTVQTIMDLLT
jgi:hypothetical protein